MIISETIKVRSSLNNDNFKIVPQSTRTWNTQKQQRKAKATAGEVITYFNLA